MKKKSIVIITIGLIIILFGIVIQFLPKNNNNTNNKKQEDRSEKVNESEKKYVEDISEEETLGLLSYLVEGTNNDIELIDEGLYYIVRIYDKNDKKIIKRYTFSKQTRILLEFFNEDDSSILNEFSTSSSKEENNDKASN